MQHGSYAQAIATLEEAHALAGEIGDERHLVHATGFLGLDLAIATRETARPALSAAAAFGVSGRPMLMAVNVMSAAAFLTPLATPGNMMVMGPGGYQQTQLLVEAGSADAAVFGVIALVWVPLVWRF